MRHGKLYGEISGGNRERSYEEELLLEKLEQEAIKKEEKYKKLRKSSFYDNLLKVYIKDIEELSVQVSIEPSYHIRLYKFEKIDKLIKDSKEIIDFLSH